MLLTETCNLSTDVVQTSALRCRRMLVMYTGVYIPDLRPSGTFRRRRRLSPTHFLSGAPLSTQIDTKYQHILTCTTKSTHTFGMIGLYLGALGCCQHACHVKPHLTLPNSLLFRSSPSRHAPSSGYFPSLPLGVMRRGGGEGVRWCASLLVCIFSYLRIMTGIYHIHNCIPVVK